MSTNAEQMRVAMIGARAALDTFDGLLADFTANRPDVDADAAILSLNDVRRLVGVARSGIAPKLELVQIDGAPA